MNAATAAIRAEHEGLGHLPTAAEIDRRAAEYRRAYALIDSQGRVGYPARVREAKAIFGSLRDPQPGRAR